jgi:hypothetical protein
MGSQSADANDVGRIDIMRKLWCIASTASIAAAVIVTAPAQAATVWTNWTEATVGTPGTALGTLNGVGATYTGELDSAVTNGTSPVWRPSSSFIGGTSTASPDAVGDAIFLNGQSTGTNSVTFDSPIVDPLMAIWSLGQSGQPANFTFTQTPTFEAGGPNAQFGGSAITVNGNVVSGIEGNGVVQLTGTFSEISWTNTFENFYGFTIGTAGGETPVPEPATLALLAISCLAAVGVRRMRQGS